jgi:hypothetical protein
VSLAVGADPQLAELLTDLVDRDEGVGSLVHIGTNNNHGGYLLIFHFTDRTVGPVGGQTSVGATPRSYQVTPAGPSHQMPAEHMNANPSGRHRCYEPDTR